MSRLHSQAPDPPGRCRPPIRQTFPSGREPETFDVIIRRYIATRLEARRTFGAWMGALGDSLRLLVTPGLDYDKLNRAWAPATRSRLVEESPLWRSTHGVS